MNILQAVILGIVQGFSEFLPISSSGHLVLFQNLFNLNGEENFTFNIILHIGTLIPVCIVYFKDIISLIKNPFQKMTALLILGTLPTVIIALLFKDTIDFLFQGGIFLCFGFILTGILLLYADKAKEKNKKEKDISGIDALIIGTMQAVAIAPSISRSGSTISTSLFRGLNRDTAAKFSFLLSVPAILGAVVLELKDIISGGTALQSIGFAPAVMGFLASMLSGYLAIRFMLNLIKSCKLRYFSYYVFLLSAYIFIDIFFLKFIFKG